MAPTNNGKDTAVVLKALLDSVENVNVSSSPADGQADIDYGCKPLINLFEPANTNGCVLPGLTTKQQQSLILSTLKLSGLPTGSNNSNNHSQNLQKTKRFFDGLREIIERIFVDDAYLPHNDTKDNDDNDHNVDDDDDSDNDDSRGSMSSTAKECTSFLKYAAWCVQAVLEGRANHMKQNRGPTASSTTATVALRMPSQVYEVASYLHGLLFSLHSCGPAVESTVSAILTVCESWWLFNGEHREGLIVQCLPLLVIHACEEIPDVSNKSHIVRLYKLRDAFSCIDYTDPSSDSLRSLLQRVASNPLCVKIPEGRKLLAYLMSCDSILVKDLHMAFRPQIPQAKKTVLDAYGEIYYRAWKESIAQEEHNGISVYDEEEDEDDTDEDNEAEDQDDATLSVRKAIEHKVLQDLMHSSIHVASSSTQKSILSVLEPLHADKKSDQVANLLFRLYSPILWRSLTAANPSVRCNALVILDKVFPLHEPKRLTFTSSNDNKKGLTMREAVLKATNALQTAMKDPYPQVRLAASRATANICTVFWEVIPSKDIHGMLNIILMDHSSDSSSAAVRAGAIEAFITLLDSAQTHAVVRNLLPALGNLIHDKAEKVRLATIKLLLRVKQIPGIRYYHVVPPHQLSARLTAETKIHRNPRNPVSRELTALMLNSYFPQGSNVSTSKLLKRTVTYLITDPSAASVFYANLADHLDVESVVKFVVLLFSCLQSAVEVEQQMSLKESQKNKKRPRKPPQDENEEIPQDIDTLSASNTALMARIANTVRTLLDSVKDDLVNDSNEGSNAVLEDSLLDRESMITLLSHFKQKATDNPSRNNEEEISCRKDCFSVVSSLMACVSYVDTTKNQEIMAFVLESMNSLSRDETDISISLLCSYLNFFCQSDKGTEDVAMLLSRAVEMSILGPNSDFLGTPSDNGSTAGRSRRNSLRSASKKTNNSSVADIDFSPNVTWTSLEYIMQGLSKDGRAIRNALMSSDTATSVLQKSFQKGIQFVQRVLSDGGETFEYDQVESGLRACEMYGRLALHKQSSMTKDDDEEEVAFRRQLEILINWTSDKLPVFLRPPENGESNLRDLDVSLISRDSIIPSSPTSSPPKQRPNMNSTPETIRTSSTSMIDNLRSNTDPAVTYSKQVAAVLVSNSCNVATELLSLGTTNTDIPTASLAWCKAVFEKKKSHVTEIYLYQSMLLLGFVMAKETSNCDLLVEVLFHYDKEIGFDDLIRKGMSQLGRYKQKLTILLFMALSNRCAEHDDRLNSSFSTSIDAEDVCEGADALEILWEVILSNQATIEPLAQALATSIRDGANENASGIPFKIKCLFSLISRMSSTESLASIFSDLNPEDIEEGNCRDGLKTVLEAVSASA